MAFVSLQLCVYVCVCFHGNKVADQAMLIYVLMESKTFKCPKLHYARKRKTFHFLLIDLMMERLIMSELNLSRSSLRKSFPFTLGKRLLADQASGVL